MSDSASDQSARVVSRGARQRADSPGVRIPPPVIYILVFLVGFFLQSRFPLPFLPRPYDIALGIVALAPGAALVISSIATLVRGKGTLNTNGASSELVTSGVYRISRNPMYAGLALVYTGVASLNNMTWSLAFLPLLIIYTQVAVILPEERFLTRHFGDAYRAYMSRVRRWL